MRFRSDSGTSFVFGTRLPVSTPVSTVRNGPEAVSSQAFLLASVFYPECFRGNVGGIKGVCGIVGGVAIVSGVAFIAGVASFPRLGLPTRALGLLAQAPDT